MSPLPHPDRAGDGQDEVRLLPQDQQRLWKWQRLLHRGERIMLDSLDKATIDHIVDALGLGANSAWLPTQKDSGDG